MQCNLFLNGGGTRLAVYLGGLKMLEEHGVEVTAWSGASAGSLVASVMASGYSLDQAFELMLHTDYRQFLDIRPLKMIRDFGLCSGAAFERWLDGVLDGRRFRDLDVPFSVVCTNVTTGQPLIFSNENTPEAKVATAVRGSIGIPGVFGVHRVDGNALIDGTLTVVEPEMLFPNMTLPSFLIRMASNRSAPMERRDKFGLTGYLRRIIEIMLRCTDDLCQPELWSHDLCLTTGAHSPIRFGMSAEDKHELHHSGYLQCQRYVRNFLPRDLSDCCEMASTLSSEEIASRDGHIKAPIDMHLVSNCSKTMEGFSSGVNF